MAFFLLALNINLTTCHRPFLEKKSIDKIVADSSVGLTDGTGGGSLKKVLGVRDLTFMGIAAIIGAGIFSTIGTAAFNGGPGIVFLFMITARRFQNQLKKFILCGTG